MVRTTYLGTSKGSSSSEEGLKGREKGAKERAAAQEASL